MIETQNDPRAGLEVGARTAFTFMVNVLPGHEKALRELIAAGQGRPEADAALKEIGTLHEFRWVMFDDDRRLMFASSFDGSWETYIQDFAATVIGEMIDRNLQHVEGWIGIKDPRVADWLLERAVPAVGYNTAYPQPTVKQIWQALALQQAFQQALDNPGAADALQHPALEPLLELAAD
jgi:hypothetical protein